MRFSIITVARNNRDGLEKTILSVLAQSSADCEFIVIDGASTDGSAGMLEKYRDRLSKCVIEPDSGVYNAMNKGVRLAEGEYCLFLNSGDTFASDDVLERAAGMLGADIVCGDAILQYGDGELPWTAPDAVSQTFWLQRCSICHQSAFIRTGLLREIPYDESLRIVADYAFFFYQTAVAHRSYTHIPLTVCRYGCDGISSDPARSDAEKLEVIDEYRRRGYIPEDDLLSMCRSLKYGGRRYRVAKALLKLLVK